MNKLIIPNTFLSLLLEKELDYENYISSCADEIQANRALLEYIEHIVKTYGSKGLSQLNKKEKRQYDQCVRVFEQYESEMAEKIAGDEILLRVFIFIKKAIYAGKADALLRSIQHHVVALAKDEDFDRIERLLKELQNLNAKIR